MNFMMYWMPNKIVMVFFYENPTTNLTGTIVENVIPNRLKSLNTFNVGRTKVLQVDSVTLCGWLKLLSEDIEHAFRILLRYRYIKSCGK
jgi:hypothetical protein